jgi:hypothetical protein
MDERIIVFRGQLCERKRRLVPIAPGRRDQHVHEPIIRNMNAELRAPLREHGDEPERSSGIVSHDSVGVEERPRKIARIKKELERRLTEEGV